MIHFKILKRFLKKEISRTLQKFWQQITTTNFIVPEYWLTLGIAEDFFLSGPTRGLAVISVFDPTIVLPSFRAMSLSHSSFCSLSTLLAWGLLVYDTAGGMDGPAIKKKKLAAEKQWTYFLLMNKKSAVKISSLEYLTLWTKTIWLQKFGQSLKEEFYLIIQRYKSVITGMTQAHKDMNVQCVIQVCAESVCFFTYLTFPPPWSLKRRCFWFAEMLRWTFRWAGDWRVLLFRSLLGRDLWHKFPLDNDSPPSNCKKKKDHQDFKTKNVYVNNMHSWVSCLFKALKSIQNWNIFQKFGYRTTSWQTRRRDLDLMCSPEYMLSSGTLYKWLCRFNFVKTPNNSYQFLNGY